MRKILIIGATSAIAEATARKFAKNNSKLFLLGRNIERLTSIVQDLRVRGADKVEMASFDVNDLGRHEEIIDQAISSLQGLDIVLIAHGTLPDQKKCENSTSNTLAEMNTNLVSTISMLTYLANFFEKQGEGTIVVVSSVAGDRGRQSNYVYGSAKGALAIFTQGMRNRLNKFNVQVLTVKPGFVDTPMTKHFKKGVLWVKPEIIANGILKGIEKRRNIIYLPCFWRWIMLLIKAIPEALFKRMSL